MEKNDTARQELDDLLRARDEGVIGEEEFSRLAAELAMAPLKGHMDKLLLEQTVRLDGLLGRISTAIEDID